MQTRRDFLGVAGIGALSSMALRAGTADTNAPILWYAQPAAKWEEALPVGNGRLGAMVFGGVENERLQLNEITVWSGGLEPNADRMDGYESLPAIRDLIRDNKYPEAVKVMMASRTCATGGRYGRGTYGSYQTLGDLTLEFGPPSSAPRDYRRSLDLARAISITSYQIGDDTWTREVFSSAPDQALVVRIACSRKGGVSFSARLSRIQYAETTPAGNNKLLMRGASMGQPGDLQYEAQLQVGTDGGTVELSGDRITVKGADEAILVLAAGTDYVLDYAKAYKGPDPHEAVSTTLEKAAARPYADLVRDHERDHRRYFDRVSLNLGTSRNAALPTDDRLRRFSTGEDDPALIALFYQFGRYLLISSSRPDNPLPSNSQGLWGDGLSLPWGCDYKSNINFQMNYWPVETANLSECHRPMLRLIEANVEPGRKTAKAYFNSPGWVMAYTTNPWGWTSPGPGGPWGPFFLGGAWVCQHLWEHYAFSRDREYLKSVYPVLKGASEACLNMLVEDENGKLITSPSTSPENSFRTDDGQRGWACAGSAVERQIVWELLNNTVMASRVLSIDAEFRNRAASARDRIRQPDIGKAGQLMEWGKDWDLNAPEPNHRHISHLFALHPGRQISPSRTPEVAAAARKSLELRGDESTGWSKAWKINCQARLGDGEHTFRLIREQLRAVDSTRTDYRRGGGTYLNLFDAHPPFQIDGNFGALSGITEMLLQSHLPFDDGGYEDRYEVHLLPALPPQLPAGEVRGIRARGGLELDIRWTSGEAEFVAIRPWADGKWRFKAPPGQKITAIRTGKTSVSLRAVSPDLLEARLRKGTACSVTFA